MSTSKTGEVILVEDDFLLGFFGDLWLIISSALSLVLSSGLPVLLVFSGLSVFPGFPLFSGFPGFSVLPGLVLSWFSVLSVFSGLPLLTRLSLRLGGLGVEAEQLGVQTF